MIFQKIHNKGEARLFQNPRLEKLSKTRPWVIYAIYIPLIIIMLGYSYQILRYSVHFITFIFTLAAISWTLFEYVAHRFLFHYDATSRIGQRIVYIFHGNHHEFPRDRHRLFMPPVPSIIFALVLFTLISALSYLLTSTGSYAFIFFPGFITGYLIYVSMHYAIHAYTPPRYLKALWRNHHLHHYKYPDKGYGVSSPLWDIVFHTVPGQQHETNTWQESEKDSD